MASPRYGERWGRHWLDLVHYADTHGYDKDKRRLWAWLYRDWVSRAFNQDVPYRRFVRYQVAGDVLFPKDADGVIATGFIAAGPWDFVGHVELREGTVDKERRDFWTATVGASTLSTFVSVTAHCAAATITSSIRFRRRSITGCKRSSPASSAATGRLSPSSCRTSAVLLQAIKTTTLQQVALQKKIAGLTSPELRESATTVERLHKQTDRAAATDSGQGQPQQRLP